MSSVLQSPLQTHSVVQIHPFSTGDLFHLLRRAGMKDTSGGCVCPPERQSRTRTSVAWKARVLCLPEKAPSIYIGCLLIDWNKKQKAIWHTSLRRRWCRSFLPKKKTTNRLDIPGWQYIIWCWWSSPTWATKICFTKKDGFWSGLKIEIITDKKLVTYMCTIILQCRILRDPKHI